MTVEIPQQHPHRPRQQGFTLIELLMVVAVILILAGITFGISRGVQNAQARAKAKAELAIIAQALEQFKSVHGDYPWAAGNPGNPTNNGRQLLRALAGFMTFAKNNQGTVVFRNASDIPTDGPRSFIDLTKVSMDRRASQLPSNPATPPPNFYFMDPWGRPYVYRYKAAADDAWEKFGYILFSNGPDGQPGTAIPATGIMPAKDPSSNPDAVDNIYAGE
ncbi:MAG: prepilin-type N-terminal cleavage/methylation domain-containing protein [Puniceicoccaceae bacterium]|nr:MAG: prepilin-type N-terminal cleavage/methylation domain-containing protein [Puniceicoccaceae bacterium]